MSAIFQILSLLPNGFSVLQCAIRNPLLSLSLTSQSKTKWLVNHDRHLEFHIFFSLFQPLKPKMHSEIHLLFFIKNDLFFWLVFFSIYSNWCSLNLFFISFKNLKAYWPIYYLILNYYAILDNLEYNPTVFAQKFPFFMFFLPLLGKIRTKMSSLFFNFDLWH